MEIKIERFKKSEIEPSLLLERVISKLNKLKFDKIQIKDNKVGFKNSFWKIESNIQVFKKPDKGNFEIIFKNNETIVKYTCFLVFWFEFIAMFILILLGLIVDYFFYIVVLLLIFQAIAQANIIKSYCEDYLDEICG